MQQAPNPEFYLCPTCNNQIRSQNRLMHEARCEFLRKKSAQQPPPPLNNSPSNQQFHNNFVRMANPSPLSSPYQETNIQNHPSNYAIPNNNFNNNYINNNTHSNNAIPRPNPLPNPYNFQVAENHNYRTSQSSQPMLQTCENCHKEIPLQNFEAHDVTCRLNLEKCPHCLYEYPSNFLPTHFNSCPALLSLCPVCNDEYPTDILQEHINANHLPPPENQNAQKKRDSSPGFFDKIKNFFSTDNNKKEKEKKIVKCAKCGNSVNLTSYEEHIKACRPSRPPPRSNQLFSLMVNQPNGRRMIIRPPSNGNSRNDLNELDVEARKMRELMLLMHLLLAQRPKEDPGLKPQVIEDNSLICKYDIDKNATLNEDYKKCSICQCDFEQDEDVRILICLHRYHKECADAWLKKKSWCPLCRKNVVSGEEERKEEEDGES